MAELTLYNNLFKSSHAKDPQQYFSFNFVLPSHSDIIFTRSL